MQINISKPTTAAVVFAANHRRGSDYRATIQNETDAVITLTYTNQNVQDTPGPVFRAINGQPTTVASGAIECVTCPMAAVQFAGTGTGTLYIVEAG